MQKKEILEKLPIEFSFLSEKEIVEKLNDYYRKGNPIISDKEYDFLIESINGLEKKTLMDLNFAVDHPKEKLPIKMGSMEKNKTIEELEKWFISKKIPINTLLVATPKLDGISLLENYNHTELFTRGDGEIGRNVKLLAKSFNHCWNVNSPDGYYAVGELIMSKENFELFSHKYANPRNLVSGLFDSLNPDPNILSKVDYIRYSIPNSGLDKIYQLDILNKTNIVKIPYTTFFLSDLSEEMLQEIYDSWNIEYNIDGIIIEVNNSKERERIGFETNSNDPAYARAYKGHKEVEVETKIIHIERNVNKDCELKPVLIIDPITIDGVTIERVFADNERFLFDYGIGIGTKIHIKRSGSVIPRITKINGLELLDKKSLIKARSLYGADMMDMREKLSLTLYGNNYSYPNLTGGTGHWDSTFTEYKVNKDSSIIWKSQVALQKIIFFFETIKVENVSDKTIIEFFNRNFVSLKQILLLTPEMMVNWEGFGISKANNVYSSIHEKMNNVDFITLLHASNCFSGIGSDKISKIVNYYGLEYFKDCVKLSKFNPEELINITDIKDISTISGDIFKTGFVRFIEFVKKENLFKYLDNNEQKIEQELKSNSLLGKIVVFTKFRDKNLEKIIKENGGIVTENFTTKTNYLLVPDHKTSSSKVEKAKKLGIDVMTSTEFTDVLISLGIEVKEKNQTVETNSNQLNNNLY
jgi:DNA ligase (NAD+)